MRIAFSPIESEQFGMNVGRIETEVISGNDLYLDLLAGNFDLVRLRVNATDEQIVAKLSGLGFPVYFSGGIRRYKVAVANHPVEPYLNNGLTFECYDGSQYEALRLLMLDTWLQYPIGYFRTPTLSGMISREDEIECVIRYYDENNNHLSNPKNAIWFLKLGTEYVGFLALNMIDDYTIESNIAGIAKSHQGKGLFHDVLRYIRNYCLTKGISNFYCGARNENSYSQRTFEKEYMTGYATDHVFHIVSLLGLSVKPPVHQSVRFHSSELSAIPQILRSKATNQELEARHGHFHERLSILTEVRADANYELITSFPVRTDREWLTVTKLVDVKGSVVAIGSYQTY